MKKTTKILMDEHQNILKVINAIDAECDNLEKSREINKEFFEKVIFFIRNYADKFHHAKEEEILFKEVCKDGVNMHCNPVEQMLYEHNLGRNFVKDMEDGVKKGDKKKLINNARGYTELLKSHIFKEDNILYPMADEALNSNIENSMLKRLNEASKQLNSVKEKCLAIVNELEERK